MATSDLDKARQTVDEAVIKCLDDKIDMEVVQLALLYIAAEGAIESGANSAVFGILAKATFESVVAQEKVKRGR